MSLSDLPIPEVDGIDYKTRNLERVERQKALATVVLNFGTVFLATLDK